METQQLASISLTLEASSGKPYSVSQVNAFGPLLQGALMELCDSSYASYLHAISFNPYSQACTLSPNKTITWTLSTLTNDAAKYLIEPLLSTETIKLRAINEEFAIKSKTLNYLSLQTILDELKTNDNQRHQIRFITPTAFKSHGEYVIMPTPRLIFQNLFMHYNQIFAGEGEADEETIEYIAQNVRISSYNLNSHYFACSAGNKTKLPAFVGEITLNVTGKQPLHGLVGMLLRFGEFAGVGIKTSMGMGMMQYVIPKDKPKNNNKTSSN